MSSQEPIDPNLRQRVRSALDAAADDLDMVGRTRLRAARHRAVERAGQGRFSPGWWGVLVPAGATAALVAVLVGMPVQEETAPAGPAEVVQDLDLLTASDSLEFYQDLEFFRWLPEAKPS